MDRNNQLSATGPGPSLTRNKDNRTFIQIDITPFERAQIAKPLPSEIRKSQERFPFFIWRRGNELSNLLRCECAFLGPIGLEMANRQDRGKRDSALFPSSFR